MHHLPPGTPESPILITVLALIFYLVYAYCIFRIAKKTGNASVAWTSWFPILQFYTLVKCSGRSGWFFWLLFIPLVNLIFIVMLLMGIAKARGKPSWLGLLIIVPFLGSFLLPYLAFCKDPGELI